MKIPDKTSLESEILENNPEFKRLLEMISESEREKTKEALRGIITDFYDRVIAPLEKLQG